MGLRDVEIIQEVYKAAETGKRVGLDLQKYAPIPEY
jgi:hypothetical protein